ncbi:MAG: von Willebrand factor type A domain-containing protein [Myxococcales bacterium]|nr:von Willebrand factor type A domain-containing protein [Myxococcales bacterium]
MRNPIQRAAISLVLASSLAGCSAASKAPAPESAADASGAYPQSYGQPQAYPQQPGYAMNGGAPMDDAAPAAEEAPASKSTTVAGPVPAPSPVATTAPPPPPAVAAQPAKKPEVAIAPPEEPVGTEQYTDHGVNPFVDPKKDAVSTFAIDVDTGAYAIARSKLDAGTLPPFAAVRAEEFLNYFDYGYAGPQDGRPFAVHLHAAPSPYQAGHHLLRVGVQAVRKSRDERAPVHLVYLVDTSGSMQAANKLGLAKKALAILTRELKPTDTVALCTYAGSTRIVLPPTAGSQQETILSALDSLTSGGGTAMSSGMEMAYQLAERTHVQGHVSRVIVLSDGDANIGAQSHDAILERIGHFKKKGITLSTVGFGNGNYKDTMMEQLANQGDGNYTYIDSEKEARRAFGEQLGGMLEVVARDVKIQVEFDPSVVARYRLIGYENRDVADRDFRNDAVDAGEIGAGHRVTALYDIVLEKAPAPGRSPIIVRLRHKPPTGSERATEMAVKMGPEAMSSSFAAAPKSFRFATAVAGFAEILRQSPHAKTWRLADVARIADQARSGSSEQEELVGLVRKAQRLMPAPKTSGGAVMAK